MRSSPAATTAVLPEGFDRRWLYFALLVHVLAVWFGEGFYHPDEHFQILETLNMLLGRSPVEDLPWEFAHSMRPAIPVVAAFGVAGVLETMGIYDPHLLALLLRASAAGLGLAASLGLLYSLSQPQPEGVAGAAPERAQWIHRAWLWTCVLWVLPVLHARFSAEGLSGSLFFLGAVVLLRHKYVVAGMLLACALLIRPQTVALAAGLGLWWLVYVRPGWRPLLTLASAALAVVVLEMLSARLVYGEWAFPAWNYFAVNILADRVSDFGVSPWWGYFPLLLDRVPLPFNLLVIVALLGFVVRFPRHWLSWSAVLFFLLHTAIGHKEFRFLFPLVSALPWVIAMAVPLSWVWLHRLLVVLSMLFCVVVVLPMDATPDFTRALARLAPGDTSLYTLEKDPLQRLELNINFYRTVPVTVTQVADVHALPGHSLLLFHHRMALPDEIERHCQALYSSLPEWVARVNINNWLSRAEVWRLYRCDAL